MARTAKEVSADDACASRRDVMLCNSLQSNFSPIQGVDCTAWTCVSDTRRGTYLIGPASCKAGALSAIKREKPAFRQIESKQRERAR